MLRQTTERSAAEQEAHRASLTAVLKEQEVRRLNLHVDYPHQVLTFAPDAS